MAGRPRTDPLESVDGSDGRVGGAIGNPTADHVAEQVATAGVCQHHRLIQRPGCGLDAVEVFPCPFDRLGLDAAPVTDIAVETGIGAVRRETFERIDDERQWFVLNADPVECVLGRGLVDRGDCAP